MSLPVTAAQPKTQTRSQVGKVSSSTVTAGRGVTFSGCGYKPGSTVTISDTAGHSYGSAPVGQNGCFSKRIVMNDPGDYTLRASGVGSAGGALITTAHVHVKALTASRNPVTQGGGNGGATSLAFTGADDIGLMVLVGAGLIGAGTGLFARGRRRSILGR